MSLTLGSRLVSQGDPQFVIAPTARPLSDMLILSIAFVVGIFICIVSAIANAFLLSTGVPAARLLMKFNAVGGIVAILLVWRLLRWSRERNQLVRERAKIVVELNHEIRNAIHAISLSDYHECGLCNSVIKQSVSRIEHALDEYVPYGTKKPCAGTRMPYQRRSERR